MLRFPVALLTATALIEAITRVVYRHLSLMKRSPYATGMSVNTNEEAHIVLNATSGLFDDIRTVLGLSAVRHPTWLCDLCLLTYVRIRSGSARSGLQRCGGFQHTPCARNTSPRFPSSSASKPFH